MEWPAYYSLPPFFTIQPVANTRAKQLQMWVELVLLYQKHHNRTQVVVNKDADSPLFSNTAIKRFVVELFCHPSFF